MQKISAFSLLLASSVALMVVGCGNDAPPAKPANTAPVAAPAPVAAADPLAPRYQASLAEGIDFRKQGYPAFLAAVSGMSGYESAHRWTEGPVVKFEFAQALPAKFNLSIEASAFGPNGNQPIVIRAGKVEKSLTFKAEMSAQSAVFEGVDGVKTLEIAIPKPTAPKDIDPNSGDPRKLGLSMVSLKVQ